MEYDRTEVIGTGGSATVYRAVHRRTGAVVALKIWDIPLDAHVLERFAREIRALRALSGHPNVVQIYDASRGGREGAWIAMELCTESLARRAGRGPVPAPEAFAIADDLLAGLAAIHRSDHLHRDIKPENVLLQHGRAKLCDLGITAPLTAATQHHLAGTGPYLAPELATGQPTVRSDIYAAALVIDAMFGPDAPPAVADLLVRASSSRPVDRPADAGTFRAALAALNPARLAEPRRRQLSPRTVRILTAIAGALLLAGTAGWLYGGPALDSLAGRPAPSDSRTVATTPGPSATGLPATSQTSPPSPGPASATTATTTPSRTSSRSAAPSGTPRGTTAAPGPATAGSLDGPNCFNSAIDGGLDLEAGFETAGGPNYASSACRDIHLKLTAGPASTSARSCTEKPDGSAVIACSGWVPTPLGAWTTLSTGVPGGTRWRLEMRASATGRADFVFTG